MNINTEMRLCKIDGCNEKHCSNGYCRSHNYRYKRYGDPLEVRQIQSKNTDGSCLVNECERPHSAKGYCKYHYYRWEKYGDPLYERPTTCKISGCGSPIEAKELCQKHYRRLRVHGDPKITLIKYNVPCKVKGCKSNSRRNGYCEEHYFKSDLGRNRHRLYSANRRTAKANAPFNDLTIEDWNESLKYFNSECAYCGCDENVEQDHVIPISKNGGHTKSNVVPACRSCNSSKRQRFIEDWYSKQSFYDRKREEKIYKWMNYKIKNNKIQLQLF